MGLLLYGVIWSDNVKMQAFSAERAVVGCCRILVTVTTNTQRQSLIWNNFWPFVHSSVCSTWWDPCWISPLFHSFRLPGFYPRGSHSDSRLEIWPLSLLYLGFLFVLVHSSKCLTYSKEQSSSWEVNRSSAGQEIPLILWNLNFHYHIDQRPPPVSILSQTIASMLPHPTSWRSVLILSYHQCLGLPNGPFPSGFPTNTFYEPLLPLIPARNRVS
jgi:hypothetical protein